MTLHQLECFVEVAEQLNFTKAAKNLYISQPALTKQLKELEQELGTILFIRTTRSVSLTESGKKALTHAKILLEDARQMREVLLEDSKRRFTTLRVGYVTQAHVPFVERGVEAVMEKAPATSIQILKKGPVELIQDLREKNLDLALVHEPSAKGQRSLFVDVIFRGGVVARVPKRHPLSTRSSLTCKDLDGEIIVTGKAFAPACFSYVKDRMDQAGSSPHFVEGNSEEAISILAGSRMGIFLTSQLSPVPPGFVSIPMEEYRDGFDLCLIRSVYNENPLVLTFAAALLSPGKDPS